MTKEIILQNPYDAHGHLRQKSGLLGKVIDYSVCQFAGMTIMPNVSPNITSLEKLLWYREEILEALKSTDFLLEEKKFLPVFTFYLSAELSVKDLLHAWKDGLVNAVKYYPKGGTTGSSKGLEGFHEVRHLLEAMEKYRIPLLIHGETPIFKGKVIDDYEREALFLNTECTALVESFPELKIVLEHITTGEAASFVLDNRNVVATITPQHCLFDSRALFNGILIEEGKLNYTLSKNGMNPSLMCRPILKHQSQLHWIQSALQAQAKNGSKKFGLGTDTAPHDHANKYREACSCGVFSAPIALELYAMAFQSMGILDHLPAFACDIMPEFYGIKDKLPKRTIVLRQEDHKVLEDYNGVVTPFANLIIPWTASEIR